MGRVHDYGGSYDAEHLEQVAFPLGGIGAGMVCLEGAGALSQVSLRHHLERYHEPLMFSALAIEGRPGAARVLEGPVPRWKIFAKPEAALGAFGTSYGLPRFESAGFAASFPFATVALTDPTMPVTARVMGWSPFTPPDPDDSSLPVAGIEVSLTNTSGTELGCVYSFHAANFLAVGASPRVRRRPSGFVVEDSGHPDMPWTAAGFAAEVDAEHPAIDPAWFRGGWFDWLTMTWGEVEAGRSPDRPEVDDPPSPGGSVYVPLRITPGETRTVRLRLSWYAAASTLREGTDAPGTAAGDERYQPWYCGRFDDIDSVADHWASRYEELRERSAGFRDAFFDTTLPAEVIEAVAANLAILKSPTVLRQRDGRLWGWEGCMDYEGCGPGSCTHVWSYAQALAHLFPSLERGLRETEFGESQDELGHQEFRAGLPIRAVAPSFQAAADGQLGGVVKAYRDWRVSGDTEWLRRIWPRIESSLDYCIRTWDPRRTGLPEEPQHVTYDIELWGPNAMTGSFYLAALAAAGEMAGALGVDATGYRALLDKGRPRIETDLFNGEYFVQQVRWQDLDAPAPEESPSHPLAGSYSPEAVELARQEGPKYQYGDGCLSDGVIGAWLAAVCGLDEQLDPALVARHLRAVHRHNFRTDLSTHANPQRPGYALGHEAGLVLCSWPHGNKPSLPFIYSDEVWTGIEYQVASHLARHGLVEECLQIVRGARDRYDGRVRNPFDEYEAGHYYIRAQSSYALLQCLTGIRYDAVERVLHIAPVLEGDLRSFLATAGGFGTAGVHHGEPFLEVRAGQIEVAEISYRPAGSG
ncbi:MAG: hypothetical protein JJLCMIEE_02799 [Acidimicrobiales bacterium]|nr:MAG: hypothetical protein EDR02_18270 [Actinomycetota bacterium]MBV6509702.1 hypothetical protein [Acidimicrobiales bacterium]RIK02643.1 MAG: hypothetical protein DCC48_17795 [Acidobacteriota bacterium]